MENTRSESDLVANSFRYFRAFLPCIRGLHPNKNYFFYVCPHSPKRCVVLMQIEVLICLMPLEANFY